MGLVAPQHMDSSLKRDRAHIPLHWQDFLNNWTCKEVLPMNS